MAAGFVVVVFGFGFVLRVAVCDVGRDAVVEALDRDSREVLADAVVDLVCIVVRDAGAVAAFVLVAAGMVTGTAVGDTVAVGMVGLAVLVTEGLLVVRLTASSGPFLKGPVNATTAVAARASPVSTVIASAGRKLFMT